MEKRLPHVDDQVRLKVDVPQLRLRQGAQGVVCSTWFLPDLAFEVDFPDQDFGGRVRALLVDQQVELVESAAS